MIAVGTLVVVGLTAAVVWVTPPPAGGEGVAASVAPAVAPSATNAAPKTAAPKTAAPKTAALALGCAVGERTCAPPEPFCYSAPGVDRGVCTRTCPEATGCPDAWCCVDHLGQRNPEYFVCAPPSVCGDPQAQVVTKAP